MQKALMFGFGELSLKGSYVRIVRGDFFELEADEVKGVNVELRPIGLSLGRGVLRGLRGTISKLGSEAKVVSKLLEDKTDSINLNHGVIAFTDFHVNEADFDDVEIVGIYRGGSEPYVPVIVNMRNVSITFGYNISAPTDYGQLKNGAALIRCSKLSAESTWIVKPTEYALDRERCRFSMKEGMSLEASEVKANNIQAYLIYYYMRFGMAKCGGSRLPGIFERELSATGDKCIQEVIPHFWRGFGIGRLTQCHPIYEASLHVIRLNAKRFSVRNLEMKAETEGR